MRGDDGDWPLRQNLHPVEIAPRGDAPEPADQEAVAEAAEVGAAVESGKESQEKDEVKEPSERGDVGLNEAADELPEAGRQPTAIVGEEEELTEEDAGEAYPEQRRANVISRGS